MVKTIRKCKIRPVHILISGVICTLKLHNIQVLVHQFSHRQKWQGMPKKRKYPNLMSFKRGKIRNYSNFVILGGKKNKSYSCILLALAQANSPISHFYQEALHLTHLAGTSISNKVQICDMTGRKPIKILSLDDTSIAVCPSLCPICKIYKL